MRWDALERGWLIGGNARLRQAETCACAVFTLNPSKQDPLPLLPAKQTPHC